MDNFNEQFDIMFHDNKKIDSSIMLLGIDVILGTHNISIKESILTKLLILFPKKAELYYYMGYIFKESDFNKAIMWFQLCIQMNSSYNENILDLTKILFDMNNIQLIHHLNYEYGFINKNDDDRVLLLLASIYVSENKLNLARTIFDKLLKNIDSENYTYGDLKYYVFMNASFLYGKTSDVYTAMNLLKRILNSEHDYNTNPELSIVVKTAHHNYMLLCDYIYSDNNERFHFCKQINQFYKNTISNYSFNGRKHTKIKIGYVCSSFQNHAVSNFVLPLLKYHNREKFEIFLYSEKAFSYQECEFINILKKTSNECADIIYKNGIDVLIDIDGYTRGNRLDIFSHRPSPVQISYIGFPNSTGLEFIKYRIVDSITDNEESTQIYSEELLKMSKCFLLFETIIQLRPVLHDLKPKSDIILGAINKEAKNSKETLETWKAILHKTHNTKILIKLDGIDNVIERKEYYKKVLDVDENRIIIVSYCTTNEYIDLFYKIDILLDTFPYSGTTTTCNSLYNSIPVVTLYNKDYHSHNVSSSLLIHSGLSELVTFSKDEYINKVIELSNNYEKIIKYKTTISGLFSTLMEPTTFMQNFEKLITETFSKHSYLI
jgi:predicted O-linked N-acetylglucosamine transferase (SPINDLY family)